MAGPSNKSKKKHMIERQIITESWNQSRNRLEDDDDGMQQIFGPPYKPSIGELESFTNLTRLLKYRQEGGGIGIAIGAPSDESNALHGNLLADTNTTLRTHSKQESRDSQPSQGSLTAIRKRTGTSGQQTRKFALAAAEGKAQYAGIIHSDLDIITSRPPYMHTMSFLEWLWLKSTNFHRFIVIILALLVCVAVINFGYSINHIFWAFFGSKPENPYVCETRACIELSKRLRKNLNKSVDPCEDFYAYVCGSSDIATTIDKNDEEYEKWSYWSYNGRVAFDFYRSESLGQMFKPDKDFPDSLILPMYKACLDQGERDKKGLAPFYDLLKKLHLFNISKTHNLTGADVSYSMAAILAHALRGSAFFQHYVERDSEGHLYLFLVAGRSTQINSGTTSKYGFGNYTDTIKKAFTLLSELNVEPADLDIIARDIACLDLYFTDGVKLKPGYTLADALKGDPDIGTANCELGEGYTGTPAANFDQPLNGQFNYTLFMRQMYQVANPSWDPSQSFPFYGIPKDDPLTDTRFLEDFEQVFIQSSPIRILRFLQWRVFYELAFDLTSEATNLMVKVQRNKSNKIVEHCVENLFIWMYLVATNKYLRSFSEERQEKKDKAFKELIEDVKDTYQKVLTRNRYIQLERVLQRKLTQSELTLVRYVIAASTRAEDVPPIDYNFPSEESLYEGLKYDKTHHLKNILAVGYRMEEWRLNLKYIDTFLAMDITFHTPVGINLRRLRYSFKTMKYFIYLPLVSIQRPFLDDGLVVSDFAGAAFLYIGALESAFTSSLLGDYHETFRYLNSTKGLNLVGLGYTEEQINATMLLLRDQYIDHIKKQYKQSYDNGEWRTGQDVWNSFSNPVVLDRNLNVLLADQKRYHVLSLMLDEFLREPKNWKHRKALLPGMEDFDAKKIYYISLINRRCEIVGRNKRDHALKYGPLAHALRTNIPLTNQDHFSTTFHCSKNSPMNPKRKNYFFDRNLSIRKFNYSEIIVRANR